VIHLRQPQNYDVSYGSLVCFAPALVSLSLRCTVTVSFTAADIGLIRKCRYNTGNPIRYTFTGEMYKCMPLPLDPTKVESTATEKEVYGRREEESGARLFAGVRMTLT
jgi:hypothetical protein